MIDRNLETSLALEHDAPDTEIQLVTETVLERCVPLLPRRRKLRILALHGEHGDPNVSMSHAVDNALTGFGQSGEYLRIAMKTKRLTQHLEETFQADPLSEYDGVEWLCPDGPLQLVSDSKYDTSELEDVDIRAWYRLLDFHIQHEHLYRSLEYLCAYIKEHGPVDGIVGFSQGAALAMMLTALCEGTPERLTALSLQGSPLSMEPPQSPFKFAVTCCGFQGAVQFYNGFYNPKIATPSLHVVAEFDTMVSAERSAKLADACEDATVVHFRGTHHVPTDRNSLYEIARFIGNTCAATDLASPLGYALPRDPFQKGAVHVGDVPLDGCESPMSSVSSSSCSSLSGYSSAGRRSRFRVIRRSTFIRRVPRGMQRASSFT